MGIAGSALSLIRTFFNRDQMFPQRYDIAAISQNAAVASGYASYLSGMGGGPSTEFNSQLQDSVQLNQDLMSKFQDYQDMKSYPECGVSLNIYADEATQQDSMTNKSVWVNSEHKEVEDILDFLLQKQLDIENKIWSMAYGIAHMGNFYQELIVFDGVGVIKLIDHSPLDVRKVSDRTGIDYGYIFDPNRSFSMTTESFIRQLYDQENQEQSLVKVFEPWEIAHYRLQSGSTNEIYGDSVLEPARWVWKRLQLMEDAMVLYKTTRSPQRYVFYVDVGDIPPNEARKELQRYKNEFKKQKVVDPRTGQLSFRYSPLAVDEDFFIAKRKEKRSSEIELLSGLDGQQTDDTNYFRDKMFAALGIPKSYLGADETIGRANLGQMDVRLAKSVMRLQRCLKNGLIQVCNVDLACRNIDPDKVDYSLGMVIPSGALEIAHIEVERAKTELAQQYQSLNFPDFYIWTKILGMSEDEALAVQKLQAAVAVPPEAEEQAKKRVEISLQDQASRISKRHMDEQQRILDEMGRGSSTLGRRLKELDGLTKELRLSIRSNNGTSRRSAYI